MEEHTIEFKMGYHQINEEMCLVVFIDDVDYINISLKVDNHILIILSICATCLFKDDLQKLDNKKFNALYNVDKYGKFTKNNNTTNKRKYINNATLEDLLAILKAINVELITVSVEWDKEVYKLVKVS